MVLLFSLTTSLLVGSSLYSGSFGFSPLVKRSNTGVFCRAQIDVVDTEGQNVGFVASFAHLTTVARLCGIFEVRRRSPSEIEPTTDGSPYSIDDIIVKNVSPQGNPDQESQYCGMLDDQQGQLTCNLDKPPPKSPFYWSITKKQLQTYLPDRPNPSICPLWKLAPSGAGDEDYLLVRDLDSWRPNTQREADSATQDLSPHEKYSLICRMQDV